MQAEASLEVRDLHVWFELRRWGFGRAGVVRAVDGVSFNLEQGQATAVVGESGCGKSTLAKTILGLYRPASGQVIFEGKRLDALRSSELRWYRSQVGYVQQDPYGALPPFMSVRRILGEPLAINKVNSKAETRIFQTMGGKQDVAETPTVLTEKKGWVKGEVSADIGVVAANAEVKGEKKFTGYSKDGEDLGKGTTTTTSFSAGALARLGPVTRSGG